jgi:hypothetical protein
VASAGHEITAPDPSPKSVSHTSSKGRS